jgi:hypothetical protein
MSRTRSGDSTGSSLSEATLPRRAASTTSANSAAPAAAAAASATAAAAAAVMCRNGHACRGHTYTSAFHSCDLCRANISRNSRGNMRCERCDYDVCARCVTALSPPAASAALPPPNSQSRTSNSSAEDASPEFECFTCCSTFDTSVDRLMLPCCSGAYICQDCFRICLNTAISDGKVRDSTLGRQCAA